MTLKSLPSNQIIKGDCLQEMKRLPMKSVDLIITDLPYGITTRNEWDKKIPLDDLWSCWNHLRKEKTPIILTTTQPYAAELINSNPDLFRYDLIWDKKLSTGFLNANRQPLRIHENILVFYEKLGVYNPQRVKGKPPHKRGNNNTTTTKNYGSYQTQESINIMKYPTSIISIQKLQSGKCIHPTQKPIELFEYLIKTYSNEEDLVLDCCGGSGTTAEACLNTRRNYICIEKNEDYFKIMQDRLLTLQEKS